MSLEDRLYPLLARYERLAPGLQNLLGRAYRTLPQRWRLGAHYAGFRHAAETSAEWSAEEIHAYQVRHLRQVLIQADTFCPFYQERFARARFRPDQVRNPTDLADCPYTTRRDLLEHLPEMVSTAVPERQRLYLTSGGSTGEPVGFYLQKGISRPKERAFLEVQWKRGGYFDGARLAVIRGDVISGKTGGPIAKYDATRDWLLLSSSHLTEARWPEYVEAIERFRPDLLHAYPGSALQLAGFLERSGQTWRAPLRGLLAGSEQLTLPQKRVLERVFRCPVHRWYGHSERVVLAGEGQRSELFYFWPTYGLVEFGPPNEDGLQEVIGTSFHNLAMPLIRYRTGDYVRRVEPGRDGTPEFPWPAVSEIAGREQEFLVSTTGRRVSLTAFNMHDRIFDNLYAVQFSQEEPGKAEFRYVPGPEFHRSRLTAIEAAIRRKLGDDFELVLREVRETDKTPRGKHRWLVSRLN